MGSKSIVTTSALLLALNLLFFTLVSANYSPCPPPPPKPCPPPTPKKHAPPHPHPPPSTPSPTPIKPPPTPPKMATCPRDTLKLGVCGNVLNGLLNIIIGTPPNKEKCCSLISGLVDLDAAVCLCTAIKANVLGINLDIPVSLSLLLNLCGKNLPSGFQCN